MAITSSRARRFRSRTVAVSGTAALLVLSLAACSGGGETDGAGTATDPDKFSVLGSAEDSNLKAVLTSLSAGACADENEALPLDMRTMPQAQLSQQVQLLAGQKDLPSAYTAVGQTLVADLEKAGQVQDLDKIIDSDLVLPAARQAMKDKIGVDKLVALPVQLNVEGIWYNKQLFADNGITEEPATWDELVADAETLYANGVQPFTVAGKDGWVVTRYIGNLLHRELGPTALSDVADRKANLTDPAYVAAAATVQDLGTAGYFGPNPGAIDYATSANEFLTGKAAMYYMGSWIVSSFNDPDQNKIGEDNIGFFPFPAVEGGKGSIDQTTANVGIPLAFSSTHMGPKSVAWVNCIAENYGHVALEEQGLITGLAVSPEVADVKPLTALVQELVAEVKTPLLEFEGKFTEKAVLQSQTTAGQLANGDITPDQFMSGIEAAN